MAIDSQRARWLAAAGLLAALFGALAVVVATGASDAFDLRVTRWCAAARTSGLTTFVETITWLGSTVVLYPATVAAAILLFRRARRWRDPAALAASLLGAVVLYTVLKAVIGRPRPPLHLAAEAFPGWAFPSGHATQSMAFYGMLAVLTAHRWPAARKAAAALCVLLILVIGATRVYLGAHWVTDVLGGYALGGAWMCLVTAWWIGAAGPARGRAGGP